MTMVEERPADPMLIQGADDLALLAELDPEAFAAYCAAIEAEYYDWRRQARPEQLAPDDLDWLIWLILAGRGYGKTRTGAEWTKEQALEHDDLRGALIGATLDDVRDTMVEGESGLLAILPPSALRGGTRDTAWNRSMCELYLANGTKLKGYSSQKADKLRGPQHHFAWGDEPMAWLDAGFGPEAESTTWSNLMLGLRLPRPNKPPQCVITGTPKPRKLLVGTKAKPGIMRQPGTVVTKGSTYDNLDNLAPAFRDQILSKYEGTRTGRQELNAEILDEIEGALWSLPGIDKQRRDEVDRSQLARVITAIDPAVTSNDESDETGIMTGGVTEPGWCPACGPLDTGVRHGFLLEDASCRVSPDAWCRAAVASYDRHEGDRIVAEVNNGGDLVETVLRTVDASVPYHKVHASRGKRTRAEPVAALGEQGRIHHVGAFDELEDQLVTWTPDNPNSPDRLDAYVWLFTELMVDKAEVAKTAPRLKVR